MMVKIVNGEIVKKTERKKNKARTFDRISELNEKIYVLEHEYIEKKQVNEIKLNQYQQKIKEFESRIVCCQKLVESWEAQASDVGRKIEEYEKRVDSCRELFDIDKYPQIKSEIFLRVVRENE